MDAKPAKANRNMINLIVDGVIFLAFLVAMAPRFSGLAVHEWLGVAFGGAIMTHLLLHWQWIVEVTKRFFGKARWSARLNYVLNTLLLIDLTVIIFTGLMISQVALPFLGVDLAQSGSWRGLHELSSSLFLPITGLHIGLHWQWIVNMLKRYVLAPFAPRRGTPQLGDTKPQAGQAATVLSVAARPARKGA